MTSKLMLAFLLCITPVLAQEQGDDKSIVTARVTDREDRPIEGAAIYKLNWFDDPRGNLSPVFSDAHGGFKFKIDPLLAPDNSNYVIIHRDGFALGVLGLDALPARVRLYPGRSKVKYQKDREQTVIVQLPKTLDEVGQEKTSQIVDSQSGKPIAGVKLKFTSGEWPDMQCEATSNENGMLSLKLLPGNWYVQVAKAAEGYCDATFNASIPENATVEEFSIGHSFGEREGRLRVKSLEPLVLSGE